MIATLDPGDALLLVDCAERFLPGGSLAVLMDNDVIPILNR
jgi:hypothetical protein